MVWNGPSYPNRDVSGLSNVKILITLSYGVGSVRADEVMAEDLGEEDIVGLFLGLIILKQMAP